MDARFPAQIRPLLLGGFRRPRSRFGRRSKDRIGTRQLVRTLGDKLGSTADRGERICSRDGRGDDRGSVGRGGGGLSALGLFDPDPERVGLAVPLGRDAEVGRAAQVSAIKPFLDTNVHPALTGTSR